LTKFLKKRNTQVSTEEQESRTRTGTVSIGGDEGSGSSISNSNHPNNDSSAPPPLRATGSTSVPGAFRVYLSGEDPPSDEDDDTAFVQSVIAVPPPANEDEPLPARLADEVPLLPPESETIEATISDQPQGGVRKKCLYWSAVLLLINGAVVAVCIVVFFSGKKAGDHDSFAPTSSPLTVLNETTWLKLGDTIGSPKSSFSLGSCSVSLSADGRIFAVSTSAGVHIYEYNEIKNTWTQRGNTIDLSGDAVVKMTPDGSFLAVGNPRDEYFEDKIFGVLRVYKFVQSNSSEVWSQVGSDLFPIRDEVTSSDITTCVSVSIANDGETVALGTPSTTSTSTGKFGAGRVSVFDWVDGNWTRRGIGSELEGKNDSDNFGIAMSLDTSGCIVAVGATQSTANFTFPGQAFVYEWTKDRWVQVGQTLVGHAPGDLFGGSVSVSKDGKTLAVGAYYNGNANGGLAGQVRVFAFDEQTSLWTQVGNNINGKGTNDYSGGDVELTADGRGFCVGASGHNGEGGYGSGQVLVYQFNSGNDKWQQVGQDLDGEEDQDEFGKSCSISPNGKHVVGCASASMKEGYVLAFKRFEPYNTSLN
jgi:hypothetical protein